jgi:hypothetical protein
MKSLLLLAVALLIPGYGWAQTASAPTTADFAGTWTAEFHKQIWLTLTLVPEKGTLAGTMMHSVQISADNEGDITKVDDDMVSAKVVHVELQGQTLQIDSTDEDGSTDFYRMVLTDKDTAELRPMTSDGASAPKPFKLRRVTAAAPTTPQK